MRTYYYYKLKKLIIRHGEKDSTREAWIFRFKSRSFIYNKLSQASTIMIVISQKKIYEIHSDLGIVKTNVKIRTLKNYCSLLKK